MDPTIAALMGAGIGMFGTVVAAFVTPVMTSRRAREAKRRDVMRAAYANGMQKVSEVPRAQTLDDLDAAARSVFEARCQIRLVGSVSASQKFNALADVVDRYVDGVRQHFQSQGYLLAPFREHLEKQVGRSFKPEQQKELGDAYAAFVGVARRDLDVEDID